MRRALASAFVICAVFAQAPDAIRYVDVALHAGLKDIFYCGGEKTKDYIVETLGSGVAFIDYELGRLEQSRRRIEEACAVVDTLAMARHKHPGQKNSLDALCRRYDVDNSQRQLHGALLDAEILADVYLMMTGGQTVLFVADEVETSSSGSDVYVVVRLPADRPRLRVVVATEAELGRHSAMLDDIDRRARQGSVWRLQALALAE